MKRYLLGFTLFFSAGAQAARLSAGISLVDFDYKEISSTANRSTEKGVMPFLNFGARTEIPLWDLVGEVSLQSTINASTHWDGTDGNTLEPASATDIHTIHRLEAALSKKLDPVEIFVGYAMNSWNRFISYGSGYREIYEWSAIPVGVRANFGETGWRGEAALLPMTSARVNVIFSDTIKSGDDTRLDLGTATGFRLKAAKDFEWLDRMWNVTPWLEKSAFGASDWKPNTTPGLGGQIREPRSETTLWGVTLSTAFPL